MDRIVVGIDGSETSEAAAREAARYAEALGGELRVVTAFSRSGGATVEGGGSDVWHIDSVQKAESLVQDLAGRIGYQGPLATAARRGDPADILVEEARDSGASLIVVGNRRVQGATRVLGSVATSVLREAPCAVLVVKTT